MSAIETANVLQALGVSFFGGNPPPDGVPVPMLPSNGVTSITRNAIGDYTILLDEPVVDNQTVVQHIASGGKASVIINGAIPRQLAVLMFDRGGGGAPAAADLDFRIVVYQVPPTP